MLKDNSPDLEAAAKILPPGVAISWGLVKEPQRGPKRELSITQIVEAAVAIADRDGLPAVSMARVAASLGYTPMSLYRYIPSKDDLLILMQESVGHITIPPEGEESDWREGLRGFVRASIQVYVEHPWFGDIPISGAPITPNNLRMVDWALRSMRGLDLNEFEKMSIVLLLASYARSTGMMMRDLDRFVKAGASPEAFNGLEYGSALKQLVSPERFPDLHPLIMSGAYVGETENEHGNESPIADDLDFGTERILDGIEHYLETKKGK
ncbi:TetR/AcrR family transcriptional regulator [Paenibacillus sp. DMB20]|uniref:TetR/AcrR family transcriptional regulator n=1 Tax=Paenibacillus sp. DMB20 TaxID=1642570 RepID=UPI000627C2BC|nr:TetR/AcrR family transcriptional regulator [Paenibacillus sp. DMB20]KKO54128.1 TetR family transcriptional regulator [Paenibacillus sp. DMB20]